MNNKELRDIASYWGSPYSAKVTVNVGSERVNAHSGRVDSFVLGNLPQEMLIWKEFKLHLRPLSALTDEELTHCVGLEAGSDAHDPVVRKINRRSGKTIEVIYNDGASIAFDAETLIGANWSPIAIGSIVAYLQSIGVYVPGTIDPSYVRLATDRIPAGVAV